MPFDPAKPAPGDDLDAVLVCSQLNALNDKIDAVPAGPPGAQGEPGEVTNAALDAAIAGAVAAAAANSSGNTNSVSILETAFTNDPPTLGDIEAVRATINAMLLAMRR